MAHRTEHEGDRSTRSGLGASGFVTPALVAVLCVTLLLAAYERGRGNYQRLRSHVVSSEPGFTGSPGPGGQAPLVIRRTTSSTSEPEFLSATLLPGRGMNVLQITASVPGRGEVPLLFSLDANEMSQELTATGADAYGAVSSTFGGSIAVPWAGQLNGVVTAKHSVLQGVWQGERLTFPVAPESGTQSTEGLLLGRGADSVETSSIPGGKAVQGIFHAGSFGSNWPSNLDVSVQTEMTAHDFELAIGVKNIGRTPSPVGIGWHPHFALPATDRGDVLLSIPATQRLAHEEHSPSAGVAAPVEGTAFDFNSARGKPLGAASLNTVFLHLQHGILTDGPVAELRHPAEGYALRLTPLTDSIRFLRVVAPAGRPWISIEPITNLDDALNRESAAGVGGGLDTLQPGDSLHWRVRLEIVPLSP